MPVAGPVAYAGPADLFGASGYLRDPNSTANSAIATTLLNAASRFIDEKCGRFFYNDGSYVRYFPGVANREITLPFDFFNLTSLQLAFYENQPLAQWLTVSGDGITPGASNYFLWPANPKPYIATGSVQTAPYQGFTMPLIPMNNSAYLPTPRPGERTIAITANWGWPAVPDAIKDLTLKLAARAWEHRQAGWAAEAGGAGIGTVNMAHHFDSRDEATLIESGFLRWAI